VFSRWFNWRGSVTKGNVASEEAAAEDEDKEQEATWKVILDKAIKTRVKGSRI
jgi:hypothetical protein